MEKRKSLENNITLPRKIRVLSGHNIHHAGSMEFPDSRSCNSSTAKNNYSAMRQMSLPASQQLQHKDKSGHTHRGNGFSSDLADAKQEVTELLERLQELSEYADTIPGCDMIFITIHNGAHVVGGTKTGCDFLQNVGSFIPYSFTGYLSSQSTHSEEIATSTSSAVDDDHNSTQLDHNSKDYLRKSVESLFNKLYGECIGKAKIKLPYSKIAEYGISLEGLPEDVVLKHPSSYGKATMRKILANKDLYHMTITNPPKKCQNKETTSSTTITTTSVVATTTTTTTTTTDTKVNDMTRFTGNSPTNDHDCFTQSKPLPGQNVKLLQNSRVIGLGQVTDGNVLHDHEIPRTFINVVITKLDANIVPLFKAAFNPPYLSVGEHTAWPANECVIIL